MSADVNYRAIGERIRIARQAAGYSQAGFGRAMGVSSNTANRWEQGTVLPPAEKLILFREILNRPIDWFLTGELWQEAADVTPLCRYPAFHAWLNAEAPENLTANERKLLALLPFYREPDPLQYTIILGILRAGDRTSTTESATNKRDANLGSRKQ